MTCREVAAFIIDYTSGELPVEARTVFERHLSVCENCRAYLALYLRTVQLGRRAFEQETAPALAAGVPEELVAAILAAKS